MEMVKWDNEGIISGEVTMYMDSVVCRWHNWRKYGDIIICMGIVEMAAVEL